MEVVANVIETCDKEAGQGSHVHMDILFNHLKDWRKLRERNAKSPE